MVYEFAKEYSAKFCWMSRGGIGHVVLVMSGKGGVGKSTVAALQLCVAYALC